MNPLENRINLIRQRAYARGVLTDPRNPICIKGGVWTQGKRAGVKQATGQPLEIMAIANTSAVDLVQEVVVPSGLDVASYLMANRNLFVDHQYDILSAVATCRSMTLDPAGWMCHGVFNLGMESPYVKACVALARAGTLAMSIGFEALDWGNPTDAEKAIYPGCEGIVRKARILEVSYTAMPMNVTCRQVATNLDAAAETAEKARKALIDAKIPQRVVEDFGVRPKRVIVVR
jgi:phage head maturation protease